MISRTLKSLTARMRHHCQHGGASLDQSWELLHRMEAVTKDAEAMEESLTPLNSLSQERQERRVACNQGVKSALSRLEVDPEEGAPI